MWLYKTASLLLKLLNIEIEKYTILINNLMLIFNHDLAWHDSLTTLATSSFFLNKKKSVLGDRLLLLSGYQTKELILYFYRTFAIHPYILESLIHISIYIPPLPPPLPSQIQPFWSHPEKSWQGFVCTY